MTAQQLPTRGLTRDGSMRLNQVFEGTNALYSVNHDEEMESSLRRRSRIDRSRSTCSQRSLNSSIGNGGAEMEDSSISSSRRAAGRGGRHRLTSASSGRRSVVQHDSFLGLSATLRKAINGGADDDDDEEDLLMDTSAPVRPTRTRSRMLSDRVRSSRRMGVEGSSIISGDTTSISASRKAPSTRRHHSMRVDRMEKSRSSRKIKDSSKSFRAPRRTRSIQVEPTEQQPQSTETQPQSTRRSRSTCNDSVAAASTASRRSRRSKSRPRRSQSVDKRAKEAAKAAAEVAKAKKSRKDNAQAAAEAAKVKQRSQRKAKSSGRAVAKAAAEVANSRNSNNQHPAEKDGADSVMDGSSKSHHRKSRPSRSGDAMDRSNNRRSSSIRRTSRRSSKTINKNHGPTTTNNNNSPAGDNRRPLRKQHSKLSTSDNPIVSPVGATKTTVQETTVNPPSKKISSSPKTSLQRTSSRESWNDSFLVLQKDGSHRQNNERRFSPSANNLSNDNGTAFLVSAGHDFLQADDSDLSDSDDDDDDDDIGMSVDNSLNDQSSRRRRRMKDQSSRKRRDSGGRRRGSKDCSGGRRRQSKDRKAMREKKRRSNDSTARRSLQSEEESIGDFADFGNSKNPDEREEENSEDDFAGDYDDNDNAGMGEVLQFDPTQIGMVQRVKQISSDKKGYEINGQTGQIAEILDPVTNLQDFSQAKGPLFNLFDDEPSFSADDFNPQSPLQRESTLDSKEGEDTESPISHRRKSLFRRGGKKKSEEEDADDDGSAFISPATLGYEDPSGVLSPKEKSKSIAQKASGYLRNMINNASISSDFADLDDDKSQVSCRSNRSARNSITRLFKGTKKKDKGTLLPDEDLSMSDSDYDDEGLLYTK